MNVRLEGLNPYLTHFRAPPRDRYDEGRSRRDTVLLESDEGTPLFLQFKQATQSVLEQYLGSSIFEQ